ncbi:MAG: VOC family protein [Actinobacteria bacterium]|nr:VOC family protein [Actinomycetota bacterium]
MSIVFVAAVVFVNNISTSREFYENILGMRVEMDNGPNILYEGGLSLWQEDRALSIIYGTDTGKDMPLGRNNIELYFESGELEAVKAQLEKRGIGFIQDIHDEPWGQRSLRFTDPDGHIVEIAEPMPATVKRLAEEGMPVREIADKTSMPRETVLKMLD